MLEFYLHSNEVGFNLISIRKIYYSFIILPLFTCLTFAQTDISELKTERILGGHYFTLSTTLRSPFILTHATTSIGVGGITDLKYPFIEISDNDFSYLQGDLLNALLAFEYQHSAKNWLALYLRFDLTSRLGTDFATLVKEGVNYATTFNIGWMIKILRLESLALSATVEVNNGDYSVISLDQFTEDIANGNPNPSLIVTNNALYGVAGLKASYGINYFLGFSGEADIGYGEPIQKGQDNEVYVIVGAEADMNFYRLIKVPISLIVGYLYSSYPRNNSEVFFDSNIFYGQLNHIGRADFILSVKLSLSRELSQVDQSTIWPMTLAFNMRYLF